MDVALMMAGREGSIASRAGLVGGSGSARLVHAGGLHSLNASENE
jgi:hypothetical protein